MAFGIGTLVKLAAPLVVDQFLGGDKKTGTGEAAGETRREKTLAQSFLDSALNPQQKVSRQAEVRGVSETGKGANFQIARLLQQEIQDSYGQNSRAAIQRIFGPNGAYERNGIRALPPSLQETLRS